MLGPYAGRPLDPVLGKNSLNFVPKRLVDDRWMFARIGNALVRNLAAVNSILKRLSIPPPQEIKCRQSMVRSLVKDNPRLRDRYL